VEPSTRDRILDAAERLFGEHGFAETSLRAITTEAGANLAAVNYYFQSKDALIQAVLGRRLGPVNQQRLALLDQVEAQGGSGPLPLEGVLYAFLGPMIELARSAPQFARVFGRIYADPGDLFGRVIREQFGVAKVRFLAALRRALPRMPDAEIFWRMHFLIGAAAHTLAGQHHLEAISDGLCDLKDTQGILDRLVAFTAAGFRAPVLSGAPTCR
jgi:AcrR family transcriptional regulator